jgi:hypothetical protein
MGACEARYEPVEATVQHRIALTEAEHVSGVAPTASSDFNPTTNPLVKNRDSPVSRTGHTPLQGVVGFSEILMNSR